jgi:hypothetical protein
VSPHLEAAADLAQEVEFEFDAYAGDYCHDLASRSDLSIEPSSRVPSSRLRLPEERFVRWLDRLNELAPPPVSE